MIHAAHLCHFLRFFVLLGLPEALALMKQCLIPDIAKIEICYYRATAQLGLLFACLWRKCRSLA